MKLKKEKEVEAEPEANEPVGINNNSIAHK